MQAKDKWKCLSDWLQVPNKSPLLKQPVFCYIISLCLLIGGHEGRRASPEGAAEYCYLSNEVTPFNPSQNIWKS